MKKLIRIIGCLFFFAGLAARAELPDSTRFSVRLELGDITSARAWLDEGLDPDFEGNLIGTGLMIGAWEGNIPLMALFLERGASLEKTNRAGETALMLAAWKNRQAAVRWLLERGARVKRPDREWTALHYAAFAGHADIVEALLAAGADINARSTNGSSVIMMSAREGHVTLARRLLEAGANPLLTNDYDDDAVAWAMKQGNYDIAQAFTSADNFAELVRQATQRPAPPPIRSQPAPDAVDEWLRKARLAELDGKNDEALAAFRSAWAELAKRQAPKKVGAGGTAPASQAKPAKTTPGALVIRAKRGKPEQQAMSFLQNETSTDIDGLLEQARQAEAAGQRQDALQLYRRAAEQIKAKTTPAKAP